jgi:hypothetical protein
MLASLLGLVTTAPAALASTAQISGTVTAGASPLEDAYVEAYRWDEEYEYWEYENEDETNASGAYTLTSLRAGLYTVRVYGTAGYAGTYLGNVAEREDATTFSLTSSQSVSGKDIQMIEGATIAGTVTGPGGTLAPFAAIDVYRYDTEYDFWDYEDYVEADENGDYVAQGLRAGTYTVAVASDGDYAQTFLGDVTSVEDADSFALTAGDSVTGKDIEALAGSTVSGRITSPTGIGTLADVEAFRWNASGEYWQYAGYAESNSNGEFTVSGLGAGQYTLAAYGYFGNSVTTYLGGATTIDEASTFDLTAGGSTTGRNIQLVAGATVAGTITAPDGDGVSYADVTAYRWDAVEEEWLAEDYESTNALGQYAFGQLAPGTYTVVAESGDYPAKYYGGASDLDAAQTFTLTSGQTRTGIDIQLGTALPPVKVASTTTLTLSPATRPYGTASTATVRVTGAGSVPAGTVTLKANGNTVSSKALTNGSATFSFAKGVQVGVYSMSAAYGGSASHLPSTSAVSRLTIPKASSTLTASLAKKKIKKGKRGVVNVTVTAPGFVPTGVVTVNGVRVPSKLLDADAKLRFRLPKLKPGKKRFTVTYGGSPTTVGATSKKLTLTVKRRK